MISTLSSPATWRFCVITGMGATLALDGWCLLMRMVGITLVDWRALATSGAAGRRATLLDPVTGTHARQPLHRAAAPKTLAEVFFPRRFSAGEGDPAGTDHGRDAALAEKAIRGPAMAVGGHIAGIALRYGFGLSYAVLPVLIWPGYRTEPTLLPALLIGFVLPSLLGPGVLAPLLGAGFFARRTALPRVALALTLAGHAVFALGLYGFAWLVVTLWS